VENILLDLDDPTLEQHDAARIELYERQDAIPEADDVDNTPAFDWLTDPGWINDPEKVAAVEKLQAEIAARPPTPGQQAEQAAVDAINERCARLDAQHQRELSTYAQNLVAAIGERLTQLNLGVPIDITITTARAGADCDTAPLPCPPRPATPSMKPSRPPSRPRQHQLTSPALPSPAWRAPLTERTRDDGLVGARGWLGQKSYYSLSQRFSCHGAAAAIVPLVHQMNQRPR
jgi:hypothetical protein